MVKEILKIRDYVDVKWRYWAIGAVFMVLNALFNGISIFSIVPLMDNIIAGKEIRLPEKLPAFASVRLEPIVNVLNALQPSVVLKYVIVFIVFAMVLKGVFSYLYRYYFNLFGIRILTDTRNKMYRKMATLSMDFFVHGKAGEITSRLLYDVNLLRNLFVSHLPGIIFEGTLAVVYLVIIFVIDWKLSLLSILIFPPLLYPIYRTGRRLRTLGKRQQESYARIGNLIYEGVYGQQIIKAYNQGRGYY